MVKNVNTLKNDYVTFGNLLRIEVRLWFLVKVRDQFVTANENEVLACAQHFLGQTI